jgi:ubiquinone/menaquinone biosynthesis C-methylase UbiE
MSKGTGGFLQPEEIIKQLNIQKDMVVADFGCGSGYFTIPLAKIVEQGKVYALDVLAEALEVVRSRAKLEGLFNIEAKRCNLELANGSELEDNSVDIVILGNILFQSSKKADIIKETKRVLKKNGELIIVDWKANQPMGPPENLIFSPESAKEIIKKQNLSFQKQIPIDDYHWGMIFKKL